MRSTHLCSRRLSRRIRLVSIASVFSACLNPLTRAGNEIKGELDWPTEWVVFAPVQRLDPVLDAAILRSVPDGVMLPRTERSPARALEPRRLQVARGVPADLSGLIGDDRVGCGAYVFVRLESALAQTATLGFGADWWLQAWLNGEPVFDTLKNGNVHWPVGMSNYPVDLKLRQGTNVLAVRFLRGQASATLALGGPAEFALDKHRLTAQREARRLNTFPEAFADRMILPPDRQAVATAAYTIRFPSPPADLAAGGLAGVQPLPARQMYLHRRGSGYKPTVRDAEPPHFAEPVRLILSKFRYSWEDRHVDAIVWTTPPAGQALRGRVDLVLEDAEGTVLVRQRLDQLSPTGVFFALGFPPELQGRDAKLVAVWRVRDSEVGRAQAPFKVTAANGRSRSGRIPLHLLNDPGARIENAPMTVGVPFPRGALYDEAHLRLLDEENREMPLQTRVTARWSRFGAVKWVLCDFTADLDAAPRDLVLEFGPEVRRTLHPPMAVDTAPAGWPALDAGRLRVSRLGLHLEGGANSDAPPILSQEALTGAFVEHENGTRFTVPADTALSVEELGSEKVVLRKTGWYVDTATGTRFCQFVTRMVFHRGSRLVRVFHTWIYTGDDKKDRIRDMGWRFPAAQTIAPQGFLTAFSEDAWARGRYLVQFDYGHFLVQDESGNTVPARQEGRTPGVLCARIGNTRVLLGAKDFWQNFPSELSCDSDAFTFHNWPRHNPPATYERPVSPQQAHLLRFAHEGELLDFRLPPEYAEDPIWRAMSNGREKHWDKGRPETANAQGIARTEEFFLYLIEDTASLADAIKVMQGLNDETLRAVVEPAWLADSGVFGKIHHRDIAKYPDDERIYELVVSAPARWNERLGFYGMWLHGDVPAWSIDLDRKTVTLYRALRKRHHGWPVGWLPFARSGDPRLLKYAEAATRQQTDACFCHFASQEVNDAVGPDHHRNQGWWLRSLVPWAGKNGPVNRSYTVDCDFIWDAYYLTGYARARDVALLFGELTKNGYLEVRGPRTSESVRTSYLDMYEATFDPWFLAAARAHADLHVALFDRDETVDRLTHETIGHFWRASDIAGHEFTGDEAHGRLALNNAVSRSSPRAYGGGGLWNRLALPCIRESAYAYERTGDVFHVARVAAYLDWARMGVYDGDLDYARGCIVQPGTARGIFTGYYIRQFPYGLYALERAGERPEPIPNPFYIQARFSTAEDNSAYTFALPRTILRKRGPAPVSLMFEAMWNSDSLIYAYSIAGPDDTPRMAGKWPLDAAGFTEISAAAPDGDYALQVTGAVPIPADAENRARVQRRYGQMAIPVAPPQVPEVIALPTSPETGTIVPGGRHEVQYWFKVPRGVARFWVELPENGPGTVRPIYVWNADGVPVYSHSSATRRVSIEVPAEQAGGIWRITGTGFVIDPVIPPYFAVSRRKWFNPEDTERREQD